MTLTTPISPFAKPVSPPQPIVVLLYATDLHTRDAKPLLAHEDLHPGQLPVESSPTSLHPCCWDANRLHLPSQSPAVTIPPSHVTGCQFFRNISSPNTPTTPASWFPDEKEGLIQAASTSDPQEVPLTPQAVTTKLKIARPIGAGRKNLLELVKWKLDLYLAVKVSILLLTNALCELFNQHHAQALIYEHLEPCRCFSKQDQSEVEKVKTKVNAIFFTSILSSLVTDDFGISCSWQLREWVATQQHLNHSTQE